MGKNIIGLVIGREYLTRVKKKSFLIITFLSPILFAGLCIVPSLIMTNAKEDSKKVAVVDNSGIVFNTLENSQAVTYTDCSEENIEAIKQDINSLGYDAVLHISEINPETRNVSAELFSTKPVGINLTDNINNHIESAVEDYRISLYQIDGLKDIMSDVKAKVRLKSFTLSEEGEEKITSSGVNMAVSLILGMIIYMFILIFGSMVMSSVIEEKSSRVIEILVSSVKSTQLMFGKIIGIALVALTQFFLWIVLTLALVGIFGAISGGSIMGNITESGNSAEMISQITTGMNGVDMEQIQDIVSSDESANSELNTIISAVKNLPLGQIVICFIFFFIFGYMLYASLFAAVGSAVENEGDSQQLQLPITIPIMIAFFIAIYAFRAPDSAIAVWGSMIPFTSPIVMLARLPFGVPIWQIVVSIALLIGTFAACAWASAKIYKIGILMFGKKTSFKDLWKWLKQK